MSAAAGEARALLLLCPAFLLAAGSLLAASGASALHSPWAPVTLALTHLATLGFVTPAAMFAVLETLGGVEGRAPARRGAGGTLATLWAVGVACLAAGLVRGSRLGLHAALAALALAVCLFLVWATRRARDARRRRHEASSAALPLASLGLAAALGLWMAHGHAGMPFPGDRALWMQVHLGAGLMGWVGGTFLLLAGAAHRGRGARVRALRMLVAAGVALPLGALALGFAQEASPDPALARRLATLAQLPALVALGALQPIWLRADGGDAARSDTFSRPWRAEPGLAPLTAGLGVLVTFGWDPRAPVLFGWFAVAGWAAALALGVVLRAAGAGDEGASRGARRTARAAAGLHLAAWVAGAAAIVLGSDVLARASGVLFAGAGVAMGGALLRARRQEAAAPTALAAPDPATWQGQIR